MSPEPEEAFHHRFAPAAKRRFAVFGRPIAHSLSPPIHLEFARQRGLDVEYTRIECADEGFAAAVAGFARAGGAGLNITTPFKQAAYRLCQRLSPAAEAAASVNSIRIWPDGGYEGHTTDGLGLCRDLARLGIDLGQARALLLGAGATARTVALALAAHRPPAISVFNRSRPRLDELLSLCALAPEFSGGDQPVAFGGDGDARFDLIINCASTALNQEGAVLPDLPRQAPETLAYDLSYGQGETAFLRWAQESLRCRRRDGIGMLVEQAACSFVWWNGGPMPRTDKLVESLSQNPRPQ